MTRKRFVKLLMSEGYSRNEANNLAKKLSTHMQYTYYSLSRSVQLQIRVIQ